MPVISASTLSDCFAAAYEAVRIVVQHMTPVILLSNSYIANGAEPWRYPQSAGHSVAHAQLRHMRPFPKNLGDILRSYKKVIIPELNNGQLIKIIRDQFLVDAVGYHKIKGVPMSKGELADFITASLVGESEAA